MDDNDFLKAFAGIDILQTEAVAKAIGAIIAKLREGMVEGGMQPFESDGLIVEAIRVFFQTMINTYVPPGAQP